LVRDEYQSYNTQLGAQSLRVMSLARRDLDPSTFDPNVPDLLPLIEGLTLLALGGSVIASWLLDLRTIALADDPGLAEFAGRVSDSGEGRWTILAAIEEGTPAPILKGRLLPDPAFRPAAS
jgi:6-phosphogluconate dehydrogenase